MNESFNALLQLTVSHEALAVNYIYIRCKSARKIGIGGEQCAERTEIECCHAACFHFPSIGFDAAVFCDGSTVQNLEYEAFEENATA